MTLSGELRSELKQRGLPLGSSSAGRSTSSCLKLLLLISKIFAIKARLEGSYSAFSFSPRLIAGEVTEDPVHPPEVGSSQPAGRLAGLVGVSKASDDVITAMTSSQFDVVDCGWLGKHGSGA